MKAEPRKTTIAMVDASTEVCDMELLPRLEKGDTPLLAITGVSHSVVEVQGWSSYECEVTKKTKFDNRAGEGRYPS